MNGPARTTSDPATRSRDHREFGPHLAYASGQPARHRRRAGQVREDALLLLRPAVRHPAQGQGQRGHRLRAVGRLPVQQGNALPEGREALPAGRTPTGCSTPTSATRRRPAASGRWPTTRRSARSPRRSSASSRTHGHDAFAVLTGASLTTEKAYLMGKFARVCLKTANIDYNGRLCMVSAGGGQQEGVRHRPRRQPVERHPRRRGDLDQRREHRRVRADHHQLRLAGARERRQGHRRRSAHHADRAHLRPVPAGQAGPRHGALQRHPAPDDRERLARSRLHRATTPSASRRSPSTSREWTPRRTAEVTGIAERSRSAQAAEWWGTAKTSFLMHARGIEHHSHGVQNVLSAINIVLASGRIGRAGLRLRDDHRPGQRPGRPRARPEVRPASRRRATSRTPSTAPTSPASGASIRRSCPQPGVDAYEIIRKIDRGEIKGLLSICFNPVVSLPDNNFVRAGAREARVLRRHRLLPERDARATPTSCCPARCTRRTKASSRRPRAG